MNRLERARVRADFLETLAVEVEANLDNRSEFVFGSNGGDAPPEVVKIRTLALRGAVRVIRTIARRARRVRL